MKPWNHTHTQIHTHTQNSWDQNVRPYSHSSTNSSIWLKKVLYRFSLLLQESRKNEMRSYMRHYVPYKPGDEFKYRTPAGKQNQIIHLHHILETDLCQLFSCFLFYKNMNWMCLLRFPERQRELKRISNMLDDIIATKWSRIAEKPVRFDTLSLIVLPSNNQKMP